MKMPISTDLRSLASAVRPAMEMPTWESMGRIFFWLTDRS